MTAFADGAASDRVTGIGKHEADIRGTYEAGGKTVVAGLHRLQEMTDSLGLILIIEQAKL